MRHASIVADMRAVLFDVDGVLLDTGPLFSQVWSDWAASHGLDPATVLVETYGRRTPDTLQAVAPHLDPAHESLVLDRMVLAQIDGVRAGAGAANLLDDLTARGLPWAVVTSGTRWFVERCLRACGLPVADVGVFSEDVAHGKPAPDCYLAAAARLGVPPGGCVVIEDAPHGVAAAKAAGCTVIAVTTTHRAADLSQADAIAPTLAAVGELLRPTAVPAGVETNGVRHD